MGGGELPLAPQWLKSSGNNSTWSGANQQRGPSSQQSEKNAYSNFRRNANRNRSYFSSGRSQHISDPRKYTNDVYDKRTHVLGNHEQHNSSDPLDNSLPFISENDVLKQSHPFILSHSGETWHSKLSVDLNNDESLNGKDNHLLSRGIVNTASKTSFDQEFPSLVTEDQQGGSERGRKFFTGLSTASQTFPVEIIADCDKNGLGSTLVSAPVTVGSSSVAAGLASSNSSTSSVTTELSITGRNMAKTLAQVPARVRTPPQLMVETQKLEELAIKQSRQLVPMTPSVLKSLVISPTEQSKLKITQQQQPFQCSASQSPHGGPAKSDVPKTSLGNLSVLGAPREFGGFSSSSRAVLTPNKSTAVDGTNCIAPSVPAPATMKKSYSLESTTQMTLERRFTCQAQSRNEFFKNLSRKNSSTSTSSNLPLASTISLPPELENCQTPVTVTSSVTVNCANDPSLNSTNESMSSTTAQANESRIFVGASNKAEEKLSTNAIPVPDKEEAAFLRSLGWEEDAEDDGGLTEEEINEFWDKVTSPLKGLTQEERVDYCKKHLYIKRLPEILDKLFPGMMLAPLNSNERSCSGASSA